MDDKKQKNDKGMSRRNMLKWLAAGTISAVAGSYGWRRTMSCGKDGYSTAGVMPEIIPTDKMTYRTDPHTGKKVSLLGYGLMRLPVKEGANPNSDEVDQDMVNKLVDYAIAHGINYFDTAHPYHKGMSQIAIGKALKKYPRDKFFLATKMPTPHMPTLEQAKEIFEKQLRDCQVEYFDYYLLHNLQTIEVYKEIYENRGILHYLLEQKRKGRIRNLGFSFHGTRSLMEYLLNLDLQWDFVQIQCNYHDWDRGAELPAWMQQSERVPARWMYEKLTEKQIPITVMEPLLGGRLTRLSRSAIAILKQAAPEQSIASWAFRFVGSLPNILCVLSGMTYMENLQENICTFSPLQPLSEEEHKVLDKALDVFLGNRTVPCTGCQYCTPCPYGVDIPAVFAHYNKCVNEEQMPKDRMDEDYRRARRRFLIGYDRSVPELQQANRCIQCGQCVSKCPQWINIPKEMQKIDRFVEKLKLEK
ncbi:aldo/keto reductase [Bacteroides sp. OF04-15BH]|uniref:aldo/keto reductase n=1 Tax=Bacteroides sp. OF04-15BH TaxID=2292281 RepID=UPI001F16F9A7|nr:aldo/keto reductase [Bacteroides sp. OF04-15BH]